MGLGRLFTTLLALSAALAAMGFSSPPDSAQHTPESITVAHLLTLLHDEHGESDSNLAKKLERLQLSNRLSSASLLKLLADLPGTKSKAALTAIGDASAFLPPPAEEIPQKAKPDWAEQKQIASRAVGYLERINPRLPNFYARRITTSFEKDLDLQDARGSHRRDGILHRMGEYKATVYYRDAKEVVRTQGAQEQGLITRGTFGPILSTVMIDAAKSNTTQWMRWEEGPTGPMAVLQFRVPQQKSHYEISGSGSQGVLAPTAYHGEMGIDPASGTILRLVLEADPALGSHLHRADIMVEYGAVAIGGKTYTCPLRSVSISVGRMFTLSDPEEVSEAVPDIREVTRLDDIVFSDYHVFRSEVRIIP